ncbi:hypothetical protein [Sandaracinus amylolyticus]|uniref:hypothetical protein n=1 Tax=Sandaracinus amylolyticus TaxID=927083 RepID=UPI001F3912D6|nr:hypothetical protein [Sandaracinus amylolyticus]UJR86255.1 Hypothetical protein I5071_83370 [Sandaracinus amylolyticus]
MQRERSNEGARWLAAWIVVAACVMASGASAQVAEGGLVYVQDDDGALVLYRRIDAPREGDGRARFVRVTQEPTGPEAQSIPVVPRSAVLTEVGTETPEVDVFESPTTPEGVELASHARQPADAPMYIEQPAAELARFRLGASVIGGGMLGDLDGWLVGGNLRVGTQLGPWFAFYYAPTFLYAGLSDSDGAFVFWSSFVGEVTFWDLVSVGVGPSVDIYDDCNPRVRGNAACSRVDEAFFGLHGRVAVNLGAGGPGERGAVSVSFEVHPTWFGNDLSAVAMLGGVGAELY